MTFEEPLFGKVAVIGVGLLGGSLCCDLAARKIAGQISIWDPSSLVLEEALARGIAHVACGSAAEAAMAADIVVAAPPPQHIPTVLAEIASVSPSPALITDLGSVKATACSVGEGLFGERFVGGHPMAGSARCGIGAAHEGLFEGAAWAVVGNERPVETPGSPVAVLCTLVRAIGAKPVLLTAQEHDRYTALISHLPHMLSFAYQTLVENSENGVPALQLAGGSYRDFSRISASNRDLWNAIFRENRAELRELAQKYVQNLQAFCTWLDNDT